VIPPATIMQILTSAGVAYSVKCVFLHFFHEVHLVSSAVCVSVCECGSACVCLCVYVSIPPACSSLCFAAHTHTRNRNSIHTVHIPIKWQEPTAPGEVHAQLASAILHRRVRLDESSYQGRHEAGRRWHHSQRCRGRLNWCADCACVCVCVCFDSFLFLFPCLFFLPRTQTSLATTSAKQPNSCKNYTRLKTKSNMYSITCCHSCRIYSKTTISCASTHSAPTNTTLAWVRML
jgi:hypothetical protein